MLAALPRRWGVIRPGPRQQGRLVQFGSEADARAYADAQEAIYRSGPRLVSWIETDPEEVTE